MTKSLIQRLEEESEGSDEIDAALEFALHDISLPSPDMIGWFQAPYSRSIDAALAVAERVLPSWYVGLQANQKQRKGDDRKIRFERCDAHGTVGANEGGDSRDGGHDWRLPLD